MKLVGQPYYKNLHLGETKEDEIRFKKRGMCRKIRKGKERRADQPLSVSGHGQVSIIPQRQISSKQFPPADGGPKSQIRIATCSISAIDNF